MKYDKDNKLRLFEICAGYGSQAIALKRLKNLYQDFDYELVGYAEFDPDPDANPDINKQPAVIAHDALHPECIGKNYGDITKIDWKTLPDFDLLTYSTPCFPAGHLVFTNKGYKTIEDIVSGDMVLTHNNRYRSVVTPMQRLYIGEIVKIRAMFFDEIRCTENHPFYVRTRYRYGHKWLRAFRKPEWKQARFLTKDDYIGYAINTEHKIPEWNGTILHFGGHNTFNPHKLKNVLDKEDFWYLMGRYLGDGWVRNDKSHKAMIICCAKNEKDFLPIHRALDNLGWNYTFNSERTTYRYTVYGKELVEFLQRYGHGATCKHIDSETIALPVHLLKYFILGYKDSDGTFRELDRYYQFTSVSYELLLGLGQCIAKVFHRPFSIHKCHLSPKTEIEGRVVNQKDFHILRFKIDDSKQDKAFYDGGYLWMPIRNLEKEYTKEYVYNMEVAEDHSYTIFGAIVHNCQSISQAGLQHGFTEGSGTRSSIIWNVRDCVKVKRPKFLMLENVKAMVSGKFVGMFNLWQRELERLGYRNFAQVLNSKDYGVPQNRERIFLVSIRIDGNEEPKFFFPKPIPLELCLADVLDRNVEEKYFLSDDMLARFCEKSLEEEIVPGIPFDALKNSDNEDDFDNFFVSG